MHDNAGRPPYDSWQLEKVVVLDLQTMKHYYFLVDGWLTLDREDCYIDQTFQCSIPDSESFSQKCYSNFFWSMNHDHIWLSIFLCSPGSRYCSKERTLVSALQILVSSLLAALYLSFINVDYDKNGYCLLYTSPSPRDKRQSRMPSSA